MTNKSLAEQLLDLFPNGIDEDLKAKELWVLKEIKPKVTWHRNPNEKENTIFAGVHLGEGHRDDSPEDDEIVFPIVFYYAVSDHNGYIVGQQGDSFDDYQWHKLPMVAPSKEAKAKEANLIKMAKRTLKTVSRK